MARREKQRPADRQTAHRRHFQVLRVAELADNDQRRWEVVSKPVEAVRVGESVFLQRMSDHEKRGFEEAFTVVDAQTATRHGGWSILRVVSSERVHVPLDVWARREWVEGRMRPARVSSVLQQWKKRRAQER